MCGYKFGFRFNLKRACFVYVFVVLFQVGYTSIHTTVRNRYMLVNPPPSCSGNEASFFL